MPADGVYCINLSDKLIDHATFNSSWYSIQKFSWNSPDVTISNEKTVIPELYCPVTAFNNVIPSEEDLNSAKEYHTSTFILPEQTNINHKTKFENTYESDQKLSIGAKAIPHQNKIHQLKTPLHCGVLTKERVENQSVLSNSIKQVQCCDLKRNQKKIADTNSGLSSQKCDNFKTNQEKPDILFQEKTSGVHPSLDSISEEHNESYKTLSAKTQLQSNTPSIDSETSGIEKAHCRPCEKSLEGLDFDTEQNSSQFCLGNHFCFSSYLSQTDSCFNERTKNHLADAQVGMHTFCSIYLEAAKKLLLILGEAVRKRVIYLPELNDAQDVSEGCMNCPSTSRIGVLFSGGIDSIIIAALADRCVHLLYLCYLYNIILSLILEATCIQGLKLEFLPRGQVAPRA